MEKGNSYHKDVSYPDCRIFLSYILGEDPPQKKKECFPQFCATLDIHLSLFTMLSEPLRNICSLTLPFFDVTKFPRPPAYSNQSFTIYQEKEYKSMKGSPKKKFMLEK